MLISLICGFSSSLAGLFMSGLAYFGMVEDAEKINQIGTWLMVTAFPLIMLGAHALDKIKEVKEDKDNSINIQN